MNESAAALGSNCYNDRTTDRPGIRAAAGPPTMNQLLDVLRRTWGYDGFRPLQGEAMEAILEDRDSLVVLPTGGGKSLCYQAPAVVKDGVAVVVSPLISLMKDQVDDLRSCGVAAAHLNSSLDREESRRVVLDLIAGRLKLLYIAPERLVMDGTLSLLERARLSFVAVDEAHCISQWGHDFRPEYRGLGVLRRRFPGVAVHTFTATATPVVRDDIIEQLELCDPRVLVGSFDRPNLHYRVLHRQNVLDQILGIAGRHSGQSGIVYCISRAEVERIAGALCARGLRALPYHAGLPDGVRHRNQDAFIQDQAEIMVATVAFGMGIDKPDVRFVIHAAMPKSVEAYQQESGRAGRDGLPAECWLFYTGGDFGIWKKLLESQPDEARPGAERSLGQMLHFCTSVDCRHRSLVRHFGQDLESGSCGACDVCLEEVAQVDDALVVGQKILSCVVRLGQRFGADYTARVLAGGRDRVLLERGHDRLSTHGLLAAEGYPSVRDWVEQLVGQGHIEKVGEFNCLKVTPSGWRLLKGEITPRLSRPRPAKRRGAAGSGRSAVREMELTPAERTVFEDLRALRRERARALGVPPYMVFGDAALEHMARRRPSSPQGFLAVPGVGEKKLADHGREFLACIRASCEVLGLDLDAAGGIGEGAIPLRKWLRPPESGPAAGPDAGSAAAGDPAPGGPGLSSRGRPLTRSRLDAFERYRRGESVEGVMAGIERSRSTCEQYLVEFFDQTNRSEPSPWVDAATAARAAEALRATGADRLKPAFERLEGTVPYLALRLVLRCLRHGGLAGSGPTAEPIDTGREAPAVPPPGDGGA